MSHFTVLIIGEDPEEQLVPYSENCDGEEMKKYLIFEDAEKNYAEEYESDKKIGYGDDKDKTFKEVYPTLIDYLKDWHGSEIDKETGRYGYWKNPNAKWDWYSLGGRWTGFLKLKKEAKGSVGEPGLMTDVAKEGYVDQALLKDIDFEGIREEKGIEAKERYERLERLLGGNIPALTYNWKELIDENGPSNHLDYNQKRERYHSQPVLKKIAELRKTAIQPCLFDQFINL